MRKLFISMVLLMSPVSMTHAEVTDISTLSNVVYIEPVSFPAGTQYALSVKMKNTSLCESFDFHLYLPDGCTVSSVNVSDLRKAEGAEIDCSFAQKPEGYYQVIAANKSGTTFVGHEGEILLVTVETGRDMTLGTYPVFLKNISITDDEVYTIYPADVETSITITEPGDGRIHFDETSTTLPTYTADERGNVTMTRTIKANTWSTIVLPFNLTKTNATSAFGSGVQMAKFSGFEVDYGDDEDNITPLGITINFTSYSIPARGNLPGGTPILIKTTEDIDEPIVLDNVTLTNGITAETAVDEWGTSGKFTGTLVKTKVPADGLFLNGNKFWYSTGETAIKAFRGWFELGAVLDKETDFGVKMYVFVDDEATHIDGLDSEQPTEDVYDLMGRKVSKPNHKGVYIVGGKKVLFK